MRWKTLLLCGAIAALFTACFPENEALNGPNPEDLLEELRVGDLPFDMELETVTFINDATGEELTVDLVAPPMKLNTCGSTTCPILDPRPDIPTYQTQYYCPGGTPPISSTPEDQGQGILFTYSDVANSIAFENFEISPVFAFWAERDLSFTVAIRDNWVTFSCADCAGKYEDFTYTRREVTLRSLD